MTIPKHLALPLQPDSSAPDLTKTRQQKKPKRKALAILLYSYFFREERISF